MNKSDISGRFTLDADRILVPKGGYVSAIKDKHIGPFLFDCVLIWPSF